MSNRKIKCAALDDEELALDLIESHINRFEDFDLVAKFNDSQVALEYLDQMELDVLFIDMHMPKFSGFDVIKKLKNPPLIILTTAHKEYALEAFELDVFDYLLKPITQSRFDKTAEKIRVQIQSQELVEVPEFDKEEIFIKVDRALIKVNVKDILYVQGLQKYVKIFTPSGRYVTLASMGKMNDYLTPFRFFSCHKSYLINLNYLDKIEGNMAFIGGNEIPIAKAKKQELIHQLNLL